MISKSGYITDEKNVTTAKGVMAVENLFPESTDGRKLKKAEAELYDVFSKYVKKRGK